MMIRHRALLNSDPLRYLLPVALAHLTIELCNNYLPAVYSTLIETMGLSYEQVGFVPLVAGAGATLVQPIFGYMSDRWDSRRIIIWSVIWTGSLMGLVGLIPSYWPLVIVVGLGSLGSAAFHPAGASVAGSIATTRRGATLSVFSVSGTFGTALSPLLIATLITRRGLPATISLIPVALLSGLLIYQGLGKGLKAGPISPSLHTEVTKGQTQAYVQRGSLAGLILVVVAVMCRSWFQVSLVTYLPEWLQGQGWTLVRSGQMLTLLLVSISAGTIIGGVLSDRIGRWQMLALSLAGLAPMQWSLMTASGPLQIGLLALTGVLTGASFPVTVAMAQETWPQSVGLASALVMGLGWLPGGIGAWFTGFLADQTSLTTALGWLIVPPVIGLSCALLYAAAWGMQSRHR
jgi:FSR family fosmidomycin resistance protein-like MFS transporter